MFAYYSVALDIEGLRRKLSRKLSLDEDQGSDEIAWEVITRLNHNF